MNALPKRRPGPTAQTPARLGPVAVDHESRLARALTQLLGADASLASFVEFLAEREVDSEALDDERIDDLVLAWASATGSPVATAAFVSEHGAHIRRVGARILQAEALDDFTQAVLTHLLVQEGTLPPRIGRYGGRGPLRAFVRMVASRLAIDAQRARGVELPPASDLDDRLLDDIDPRSEIEHVEAQQIFGEVLAEALRGLRPVERRALRMRYVLGFSVARTAAALHLHEVSVSRLVSRVRNRVLADVQHALSKISGAPASEALAALARSLDLSVARWLHSHDE